MSVFNRCGLVVVLVFAATSGTATFAGNFTSGEQAALKFGVHEIVLTGDGSVANPFDTIATVKFVPPSVNRNARIVHAFFDGVNTWRARVYVSEVGGWKWSSTCKVDQGLDGQAGEFTAGESKLRGRLLPHPKNSRQWITEDGRCFLNLNDTAYFLLCAHDGNGEPVSDERAIHYVRDGIAHGITSVRCFLASRRGGFAESQDQWIAWHFETQEFDLLRLETMQCADRRMQTLLDEFPEIAVQLTLFPLEAYARDDRFWTALSRDQRERLLRNIVARFAAHPQIFWLMTNVAHYGDKYPNRNAMAREVGAYLLQHDAWQHPRSTGHARKVPFYFGDEDWVNYIHIEHEHDLGAREYAKYHAFAKPVFLGEDRYEQDHGPSRDPTHMRYWQRWLYWAWLLSGGSTNYGGRWWALDPYSETGTRPATYHQRPAMTFSASLKGLDSVLFIRNYFEQRGIDLGEFEPDHALAEDAAGGSDVQSPRLVRRGLQEFVIYHPHAAADAQSAQPESDTQARLRLDLRGAPGTFAVEWYRAEDGETLAGDQVAGGDWRELVSPWTGADIVVKLLSE